MCSRISHFLKMLSWLKCWYRVDFHQVFVWRSVYLGTLSSIGGKTKWRPWWIWGKGLLLSDIWLQIQSDLEVAVGLNLDRFKCWIWNVEDTTHREIFELPYHLHRYAQWREDHRWAESISMPIQCCAWKFNLKLHFGRARKRGEVLGFGHVSG